MRITVRSGLLSYIGHIGMYVPKRYGFSAAFVTNKVSILIILVINRIWFSIRIFFRRSYFFILSMTIIKSPSKILFTSTVPAGHKLIGNQNFGQVINRVINRLGKIADFCHKLGKGFKKHPIQFFLESPCRD